VVFSLPFARQDSREMGCAAGVVAGQRRGGQRCSESAVRGWGRRHGRTVAWDFSGLELPQRPSPGDRHAGGRKSMALSEITRRGIGL